ncbi:MAG TPA: amino acid adenylation domain-containing protein [Kofleriaceae bacterium]|nr:amino acid adenylation domain-containing protein [Kofleriaceae bacterium]
MEDRHLLTPTQLDIHLDHSVGSPQNYGIGAHWKVSRAIPVDDWRSAAHAMERVIHPMTGPLAAALGVRPACAIAFDHVELAGDVGSAQVEALARQIALAPWDFASGFLRVTVICVAPDDVRLVVASHHMVFDGSAIVAFSQALFDLCTRRVSLDELVAGQEPYAAFLDEYRREFDRPQTLAFWQRHAGALQTIVQPSSQASLAEATTLVDKPVAEADRLKALCRSLKISPAFYFKCLFAWVVTQHHGLGDGVAVSEIVNHRPARLPQLLGSFIGFAPFVLAPPRQAHSFGDLVEAARAFQHERRGTSHLSQLAAKQHGLKPEGMRFVFNFHDYSRKISTHGELSLVTAFTTEDPRSVQFYVYYDGDGALRVRGSHPEGIAAADRFLDSLLHVHRQLVLGEHRLAALEIASPGDQARIARWNDTAAPFEDTALLHALFERRVEIAPMDIALVFEDQQVTYAELNRRANQVAHWLRQQGVEPDDRVGLYLERSIEMLVGILGILKAGGAYLPLEPEYPAARLAYVLENARARIILTQSRTRPIAGTEALRYLALDAPETLETLSALPATNLDPAQIGVTSRNLAYVMYTSGSTGQPKGVMLEHRGVVNRLAWTETAFHLTSRDVCLQKTPFGFDISVWELLWPLQAGARLVIARPGGHRDPSYLSRLIAEQGVTIAHFVASMLRVFIDCADLSLASGLKHIVSGGEALPPDTHRDAVARLPGTRIWNLYGPTEATIEVTYWHAEPGREYDIVPIGKPMSNTRCYIVNPWRKLLPVGMAGELYLAGVCVARGYLGRPDLTDEKFADDPFASRPGERMYATGDLARYLPDGTIEYLGRMDAQVKIRGFRIELGEIETVLREHPAVREAVVIARGEAASKQLVAYVVPEPGAMAGAAAGASIDVPALREHLAHQLPDYMVPSVIVELDAMPLNANGKLDRKALPAPEDHASHGRTYEPPEGEIEVALAAIWSELMEIEAIGRRDSFFDRGGHSLLAMRLSSRVQARFDVSFPLVEVFANPTLVEMAAAVARASRQALPRIAPASREAPLPVSFAQQRLWFLAQLEGLDAAYHIPAVLHLSGALDRSALRAALDRVIARHEVLRTTFVAADGQPVQVIAPAGRGFALAERDLSDLEGTAQEARVRALSLEEATRPFDLATGPLIRGQLLQLGDHQHVLLITQHHIISDGWSFGVLAREVGALYRAFAAGAADPLPPLAIQYADHAAWQRTWLSGERLEAQASYWRGQLAQAPVLLELPLDRPRPERQAVSGAALDVTIDAELTRALARLSQQHGATLFMTVLAAWAAVLSRLSGQEDIVIGAPVANRNQPETLGLIGLFVNTLALRVDVSGQPDAAELLRRVRHTVLAGQEHQDLPFEQVVEIVQPPRRLSHTPLFQVVLAWQGEGEARVELPGLQVRTSAGPLEAAKFDLELSLAEDRGAITGQLRYATALFDEATIERHRGYLLAILRAMAADAGQPLHRIDLLSPSERELVLCTWNQTQAPCPAEQGVHALFEQQAAATPDAIAVIDGADQLSYAELDARASRLARHLVARGVTAGDRVATLLPRSAALVVAELAILKAGAAYVPVDPQVPGERQAWLISDSGAKLVITLDATTAHAVPALQVDPPEGEPGDRTHAAPAISSEMPAYIMYTSGSSGTPKGVIVPHRGIHRLVRNNGYLELGPDDRVAFAANPAFDASTLEVWGPLSSGGTCVVIDHATLLSFEHLRDAIRTLRITVLWLTAGLFHHIADEVHDIFQPLRVLLVGGDALEPGAIRRVLLNDAPGQLINGYGPTETTTFATTYPITACDGHTPLPIGRPIASTSIYLLDDQLQPVPLGAVGEICIGGAGVALGYLDRPDLTAERFVPDPFAARPDARMYRTGDRGRYRADGTIEFLGRLDGQVKIRGFRVELGEIEARLREHPAVRDAVVIAHADAPGGKRLVAHVVPEPGAPLDVSELRAQLARQLPDYMVPSTFVQLSQLPLTANGKVDRRALPAPQVEAVLPDAHEPPAGEHERAVAAIWSELLGVPRVGRHDHFFELGGHSLLATRVISRLRRLAPDLPLRAVFERPTVASLAELLCRSTGGAEHAAIIPRAEGDAAHEPSFVQQRLWFVQQLEPTSTAYNMFSGLRMRGPLDVAALRRAFEQLVARHDVLRTRFHGHDRARMEVVPGRTLAFDTVDLTGVATAQQEAEVQELVAAEAARPFNLSEEPLLRVCLIALEREHHVLLLDMHHIVSDGWSVDVMLEEVGRSYAEGRAGATGGATALAPLPIQYADYAAWQRQLLAGDHLQGLERYWRGQLSGKLPALTLPTELPPPEQPSRLGDQLTISVDGAILERLHAHGHRHAASLFMMLVAATGALFHRVTTQDDLILGTPVAGRTRPETEGLIGCLINALALRLDLTGNPTFEDLLERVKAVCLGAYEHQDMPFEKLVDLLQPERQLGQHPIFDVLLNVVNVPARLPRLDGLTLTEMEVGAPQAKFGLTIYAVEQPGRLELRFVWQRDRYSSGQMHALAHQLAALLEQIAADPSRPIGQYSLVTAHDRKILADPTAILEGAPIRTMPAVFREIVVRHPDVDAIRARGRAYSYRTLAQTADAISQQLLSEDRLAPGDCVVITGPRSFGVVAAMIGVLQAGGVILTLDKNLSPGRRRDILAEARAKRLICVGCPGDPWSDVCRDVDWQSTRFVDPDQPTSSPVVLPDLPADSPAYLFFTSGTTGRPKGILGQHGALAHFLTWQRDTFQIGVGDRAAQLTGLGFDVVLRDILTPLISGATLCLLDHEEDLSAATLFPWFRREEITLFHTVPTIAKSWLMDERQLVDLPALQQVFFAGEPLPSSLVRALRRTVSETARIVNLYGPTETTLAKGHYIVPDGERLPATLPVGRPMTATQLLVLNAARMQCGVGEPGEVVIRTRFPSLGYLSSGRGAPQFLPNPFRDDATDLVYLTGDLGHVGPDGLVWLTGRKDDQVKIRGMRVELGEIHAALIAHPGVREAAVLAFTSDGGDKQIAAYYVPGDTPPEPTALRDFVRSRLADYMVPLAWIQLDGLPMTPNGKLDRQRLPDPRTVLPLRGQGYVAPTTDLELAVVGIWQEVLRRAEIGVHENFFDLGGNSLLLLQVKTRLQAALRRDIPVVALFQYATAAGLAKYLGGQHQPAPGLAAVADRVRVRKAALQNRRRR